MATSRAIRFILLACAAASAGCQGPGPAPPDNGFVPFKGADVVRPGDAKSGGSDADPQAAPPQDVPVDQFIVRQLEGYAKQMPPTVRMAPPEVLWASGGSAPRQGAVVVLLARNDVYGLPSNRALHGRTLRLVTDLMASVDGHVTNQHRIAEDSTSRVDLTAASVAQAIYATLNSVGLKGRIQNANRWVIGRFRESDKPVEAFRPMFDELWEACDSLRVAEPVLIVGEQVLGEDDLRVTRLHRQANRPLDWPTYGKSVSDPGLRFTPETPQH